jgi:D-alanyl-lipoteichoic acid acyltransferase DltB (MBOAT superfamily)
MVFNSLSFALFFAIVLPVTTLLQRRVRTRNAFLVLASYFFYGCWDWRFLALIWISTVVDYLCGLKLNVSEEEVGSGEPRSRTDRLVLLTSLITNLGILGFFKYFDFFVDTAVSSLNALGIPGEHESLGIILPVGISFYTFQTLSYTIDLYRRKIPTERSLLNFATFVAFFPQLVAGPIERASNLLPQFRTPRAAGPSGFSSGLFLIGWGLVEKVVIADNAAKVADALFAAPDPGGLDVVIGVYAFALQIYGDFSGYSDIARGVARCMGFDVMRNFNLPYFAVNPSDFWRRWHISLSTWLRDYLYISMGGNRKSPRSTYVNLMTTMVLGGLWHGAAMNFVVWGFYQGTVLCVHRFFSPFFRAANATRSGLSAGLRYALRAAFFFQITCLGWLIFRVESLAQLRDMLAALATSPLTRRALDSESDLIGIAFAFLILLIYETIQFTRRDHYVLFKMPVMVRALAYSVMILSFILFGEFGGSAFIYFQF